jgi:hypothetical protein
MTILGSAWRGNDIAFPGSDLPWPDDLGPEMVRILYYSVYKQGVNPLRWHLMAIQSEDSRESNQI